MKSACTIVAVMLCRFFSSVSALKLYKKKGQYDTGNLSPCLQKTANDIIQKIKKANGKYTIQATCHSYSGVNMPLEAGGSKVMSLLECTDFKYDPSTKLMTVEPGVRYLDVVPTLRKEHVFMTHGNYAGQTIIGLLSTGTHGTGWQCPHNFIRKITAINGLGELKYIEAVSPEFSAWQLSMGVLGAILQMVLGPLQDEFRMSRINIHSSSFKESIMKTFAGMKGGKPFSLSTCLNISDGYADCWEGSIEKTDKPFTPPFDKEDGSGCCASMREPEEQVVSSVDGDLFSKKSREPPHPTSYNCDPRLQKKHNVHTGRQVEEFDDMGPSPGIWLDQQSVGYEFEFPDNWSDVYKFLALVETMFKKVNQPRKDSKMLSSFRHTHADTLPPLLSPYKYSAMVNVEFYLNFYSKQTPEETRSYLHAFTWLIEMMRLSGTYIRLHVGKGAIADSIWKNDAGENVAVTPPHDMYAFNMWKKVNDPYNLFTNQKWEAFKKTYALI